ncbi:hypothetical protein FG476_05675 [Xylella fastidiosa subsp. multiplex]|uniref:Uncharacterized protein n=1 Tax=Xylella fastidiosa subsp. multiplex TaxID=644357 RepID=A0A9Q4QSK4_XYLFS|nr:hypothetical protein Xfasm12_1998 [Xylella fastidiosa M12]MRT34068.1 hypothetical protein [Xylella fastidiosa subsp. multiplex]MRT45797.1 hypothetical protein [Xylella fastidiosa subsp. multiplex]MRT53078.1 hypothetical protein [Xylella fastidiosa subsp. multiplex]MRT95993.1 hypothetical protein [Xylella fastidiosa subsp. multiplex]
MRAGVLLVEQFCVFLTFTTVVFLRCSSCLASNGLYRFLFSQELGAGIRRCGDRLFVYRFDLVAVVRGAIGQGVYTHSVVWVKKQCARLLMSN